MARFSIGTLPAGTYRLELYRRDLADLNNIRLATTTLFTVSPIAVPTIDLAGRIVLATFLAALAIAAAKFRRVTP
jgi:hypothetical protein